jgi:hypothetical protein
MSAFFEEVCRILGVKHIHTTSFHPIGNSPAERMNKTMNRAFGFYVNNVGNDWDDLLPLFLMAQRAAPSSVTGYSPYYLLHGYEMQTPSTRNLRANLTTRAQSLDEAGRLRKLQSALRLANKTVRERMRASHDQNKRYYDRTAKARSFRAGDIVYLYVPAIPPRRPKKWANYWKGPYRVKKQTNQLNYLIEDPSGQELITFVLWADGVDRQKHF